MASIEVLAQREARAEANKTKVDDAWREAWWATTIELGKIPEIEKKQVGAAQAAVREITGQGAGWVRRRTATGRSFGSLKGIETLPPRMAVEAVELGMSINQSMVNRIRQAERDGMSIREFRAEVTGQGWADTPAGASEKTITQIVKAQPERVAKVVARNPDAAEITRVALRGTQVPSSREVRVQAGRDALRDPDIAREVIEDKGARRGLTQAQTPTAQQRHQLQNAQDQVDTHFEPIRNAVKGLGNAWVADSFQRSADSLHNAVESELEIPDFERVVVLLRQIVEDAAVYAFRHNVDFKIKV